MNETSARIDELTRIRRIVARRLEELLDDGADDPPPPRRRPPPAPPERERPPVEDGVEDEIERPPRYAQTLTGEQWPEIDAWIRGEPTAALEYTSTRFLCGQRSGLFSGNTGYSQWDDAKRRAARRPVYLTDCLFVPEEQNYPPSVGPLGTKWASRMHLINHCRVQGVDIRNIFGECYAGQHPMVTSNEGHGLYWTLAPVPDSEYVFSGVRVDNLGGNALQFVTAVGDRVDLDAPPEPGGSMLIKSSSFVNCCQSPVRGGSALSFFDCPLHITLERVSVEQGVGGVPYPRWGWDGDPENAHTARGCLVQVGHTLSFTIRDSVFRQHGGRPDRAALSFRGAEQVLIEDTRIDGVLLVNYTSKKATHWTKRLVLRGCTGTGVVQVGTQVLGSVREGFELDLQAPA